MTDYNIGDYVVYPTHGVGQIEGIETQEVAGHKLELIAIKFSEDRMTLHVPMMKAKKCGLRALSDDGIIEEALTVLKSKAKTSKEIWARRAQNYEQKINSGDPVIIAEVIRDLYRKVNQPEQSFSERKIYEQAFDRLANEVAASRDYDNKDKAAQLLYASLKLQP
ncbi:MAG: CarD family transcriptional regulator [Alphaproteobacteria bacterium]